MSSDEEKCGVLVIPCSLCHEEQEITMVAAVSAVVNGGLQLYLYCAKCKCKTFVPFGSKFRLVEKK